MPETISTTIPEVHVVTLSDAIQEVLIDASREVMRFDLIKETEDFILEAQTQAARLPEGLRRDLLRFRRFGDPGGGLLIRGVPIGEVPPTPSDDEAGAGTSLEAAARMSVLLATLGEQVGYRPELGGRLTQGVRPKPGNEEEQISSGSLVDLKTHNEMAFSELRSDYVALLGLRSDHEGVAGTTISSVDAMLPLLDHQTVRVLRQARRFRTQGRPVIHGGRQPDGNTLGG